jgi:hypothetical protein
MGRLNQFFPSHAVPNWFTTLNIKHTKCIDNYLGYIPVKNYRNRISHSRAMEVQSMLTFPPAQFQDGRQVIFLNISWNNCIWLSKLGIKLKGLERRIK